MQNKKLRIVRNAGLAASDVFEDFLLAKRAKGAKTKTTETYRNHFRAISHHLDTSIDISDFNKRMYEQMISSMINSGLARNSIRSYTITLKAFLSWCNEEGLTTFNIKAYKGEETIKETYTIEELEILLRKPNLKKCSFVEYRNWVIINLLVNNGCRAATIREIRNKDLDLDANIIFLRHLKGGTVQTIPLCSALVMILREYVRIRGGEANDYLFPTEDSRQLSEGGLRTSIERYNRSRGIDKTSIHAFRHTFARMYLLDCGGNALTLQKLLNHSTLDMTKHYCKIYDPDIARDFDQHSPLICIKNKHKRITMKK